MNRPKDLNAPSRWNMRIWDDDKKEWLCESEAETLAYYGFDIRGGEVTVFQGLPKFSFDRHLIWEQSTGLKDKNEKEIYEGDIVDDGYSRICEIKWSEHFTAFEAKNENEGYMSNVWFIAKYGEVIGNIHQNPELLGGEE